MRRSEGHRDRARTVSNPNNWLNIFFRLVINIEGPYRKQFISNKFFHRLLGLHYGMLGKGALQGALREVLLHHFRQQ